MAKISKKINTLFVSEAVDKIGSPIKFNKTALQLEMALNWAEESEDLISSLINGKFYNGLRNDIESNLPELGSSSKTSFWGNENPSISTLLLYSVANSLGISVDSSSLKGAATAYPFYDKNYSINDIENNPFYTSKGALLFGEYQYGGHRYFDKFDIFAPEDCSSAVGKANNLTYAQVHDFSTKTLKECGDGFKTITCSDDKLNHDLIKLGDTLLFGSHASIIYGRNSDKIQTAGFSRDIEINTQNKKSGGGTSEYNLNDLSSVSILRNSNVSTIKESVDISNFLTQVDRKYNEYIAGDCNILFDIK